MKHLDRKVPITVSMGTADLERIRRATQLLKAANFSDAVRKLIATHPLLADSITANAQLDAVSLVAESAQ